MKHTLSIIAVVLLAACGGPETRTIGSIERIDPALDAIIDAEAVVEILGEGYNWSEGPVWVESEKMLLFSDVPANTVFQWKEGRGVSVYLQPSGYTRSEPSQSREPGSNGLLLDAEGKLILCQHGDRRMARMDAPLADPMPVFVTVADRYEGKRFNSPNDAVLSSVGDLYFTDPPYGLPQQERDSTRELDVQGVYKVSPSGQVTLLVDSISRPNGVALMPDEHTLIIANSDPSKPVWYAYDIDGDSLTNGRIFFDAANDKAEKGLPDGLKIDREGNVFASGPGGIWIFDKGGKVLGRIKLPEATSNCALADDDRTLYITCDQYLLRVKMRP